MKRRHRLVNPLAAVFDEEDTEFLDAITAAAGVQQE